MTVATTPELAARATLMPVDRLGVDAAVLFADIMLPLACIGVPFEIRPGVGPVIAAPIRSAADVDRLHSFRRGGDAVCHGSAALTKGRARRSGRTCSGLPAPVHAGLLPDRRQTRAGVSESQGVDVRRTGSGTG